tara:strand:+ start:1284 stop:2063 length:780 start_codon:yes stop_codon:yes gene_type:complete
MTKLDTRPTKINKPVRQTISIGWLIPNLMTVLALSFGLTGLKFALAGKWEETLFMLILAVLFDTLDGRIARLLRSTSEFGGQLDSLSDAIVFGVIPSITLYLWALQPVNKTAWTATLFFCICSVLRLARFNSEIREETDKSNLFFAGIPMPAAALLVLLPLVCFLEFENEYFRDWRLIASWTVLVGIGAISTVPTYAGKQLSLPKYFALPFLSSFAIIAAAMFVKPWLVWIFIALVYVLHIPFSVIVHRNLKFQKEQKN